MLNTTRRLPRFLKTITFWKDFIEEVDTEFSSFKEEIDLKKKFFNPRELTSIEELRNLNRFFGFVIDTSLLNDYYESDPDKIIDYLKSEADNMVFKILSKGTKNGHEYMFNRIQEKGFVYVLFHDEQDSILYRALNYYDDTASMIHMDLQTHDFAVSPFTKITPLLPFASGFLSQNNLDQNLKLDDSWSLDYTLFGASVSMTKHIAAEFVADATFQVGSDTHLITNEYLEYLRKSTNFVTCKANVCFVFLSFCSNSSNCESVNVVSNKI